METQKHFKLLHTATQIYTIVIWKSLISKRSFIKLETQQILPNESNIYKFIGSEIMQNEWFSYFKIHSQSNCKTLNVFSLIYEDIFNLEKLSRNAEQFKMLHGAAIIMIWNFDIYFN